MAIADVILVAGCTLEPYCVLLSSSKENSAPEVAKLFSAH